MDLVLPARTTHSGGAATGGKWNGLQKVTRALHIKHTSSSAGDSNTCAPWAGGWDGFSCDKLHRHRGPWSGGTVLVLTSGTAQLHSCETTDGWWG
eukprot:1160893-Pelagomonas_calceolata.AAC.5